MNFSNFNIGLEVCAGFPGVNRAVRRAIFTVCRANNAERAKTERLRSASGARFKLAAAHLDATSRSWLLA